MSKILNLKSSPAKILWRTALWHVRYYATGRGSPLIATFQLTNGCNLRCIMCNIPNNPERNTLPFDTFKGIAEELNSMGCCYASLSGGEVLTIPGFFEYLRTAKRNIPFVNMVSNGVLLDSAAAMEIKSSGADSVSVSLDGMEKAHNRIRNSPGAWGRTVEAIENLKKHAPDVTVVVNTVITPWNIDELFDLTRFVHKMNLLHKFQPLNEHPRFEGQTKVYDLSRERVFDIKKVKEFIAFLLKRRNIANSRYFLKAIPKYLESGASGGVFGDRCLLPHFYCEFRENAQMYPCLGATAWKGGYPVEKGVRGVFGSERYQCDIERLKSCRLCQKSFSVCYLEPRVTFPITSFLRYRFSPVLDFFRRPGGECIRKTGLQR